MTKTKLEIIGEYRKDHPGPFCTRSGQPVDLRISNGRGWYPLIGYIGDSVSAYCWRQSGLSIDGAKRPNDLMCAREVPVAREAELSVRDDEHFRAAVITYGNATGSASFVVREILSSWLGSKGMDGVLVREVLPGEGA